jgi:hypothetical protein
MKVYEVLMGHRVCVVSKDLLVQRDLQVHRVQAVI